MVEVDRGPGKQRAQPVRPWLLGIFVVVLCVGVSGGALLVLRHLRRAPSASAVDKKAEAAAGRAQRERPAALMALAPLPTGAPLIERPGVDGDGYPRSYVDKVALRSLLGRGKFRELSAFIEQFQHDFEADFHKEYFVSDSGDAFDSAELDLNPQLDAWLAASPDSFAPYLARGAHALARGFAQRGAEFASETQSANFHGMEAEFAAAFDDLEHALRLNPRVVAARRDEMRIAFAGSAHHGELRELAKRAFHSCPACFQVRVAEQYGLEPRWGGSYSAMTHAARKANPASNVKFRLLAGYADRDRSQVAEHDKQYPEALSLINRACALGDDADFLVDKARYQVHADDYVGAVATLARALELRPQRTDLLFARADALLRGDAKDAEAAYRDLMLGLKIEPTNTDARRVLPYVVGALSALADAAQQKNDSRAALRYLDEAFDLAPSQPLENRRKLALISGFHGTEAEVAALQQAVKAAPNDFYAHQRLDYALSTLNRWDEIVSLWSKFITDNPSEGRAYFERSGTYAHMPGMQAAAKADTVRACDLGVNPACVLAKHMP